MVEKTPEKNFQKKIVDLYFFIFWNLTSPQICFNNGGERKVVQIPLCSSTISTNWVQLFHAILIHLRVFGGARMSPAPPKLISLSPTMGESINSRTCGYNWYKLSTIKWQWFLSPLWTWGGWRHGPEFYVLPIIFEITFQLSSTVKGDL